MLITYIQVVVESNYACPTTKYMRGAYFEVLQHPMFENNGHSSGLKE